MIEHGMSRFDSGAQGEHKIQRGFEAIIAYSNHWIAKAFSSIIPAKAEIQENRHLSLQSINIPFDYLAAAFAGAMIALIIDRIIRKIRHRWRWRSREGSSAFKKNFTSILVLVAGFSGYQFYEKGRVTWPTEFYWGFQDFSEWVMDYLDGDDGTGGKTAREVVEEFPGEPEDKVEKPNTDNLVSGRVIDIIDGDSITLRTTTDRQRLEIRLYGIDTPEWDQPHGSMSSRALSRKIDVRNVEIEIRDRDNYGRLVSTVFYRGENINLSMVREGHAWWYRDFGRGETELREAEELARENGLGLWTNPNPIPPWEWRRR